MRGDSSGYALISDTPASSSRLRKGASNGSKFDVRKGDLRIGAGALHIGWRTTGDIAFAARNARFFRVLISRVVAVQPKHIGVMVVPETHNEYHAQVHAPTHGCHATKFIEGVDLLLKDFFLRVTPFLRDGIAFLFDCQSTFRDALQGSTYHARNRRLRVADDLAVLHIEALDLGELS